MAPIMILPSLAGTSYPGGGYYLPNATNSQVIGTLRGNHGLKKLVIICEKKFFFICFTFLASGHNKTIYNM